MLTYDPGSSIAHRLDPRTKLLFQAAVALAAFAHTTPDGLAVLTVVVGGTLAFARLSPLVAGWEMRFALPFLLAGPLLSMLVFGPPWVSLSTGVRPALASYRVLLVLLVSVAYVRTTPVRDSRAAVQRLVPGKPGRVLGAGIALVFRFLPVLVDDLSRARAAMQARLGTERPVTERMGIVANAGVRRAFSRADSLSLALRARCFAWNPTLPALGFARRDLPALAVTAGLLVWAFV